MRRICTKTTKTIQFGVCVCVFLRYSIKIPMYAYTKPTASYSLEKVLTFLFEMFVCLFVCLINFFFLILSFCFFLELRIYLFHSVSAFNCTIEFDVVNTCQNIFKAYRIFLFLFFVACFIYVGLYYSIFYLHRN